MKRRAALLAFVGLLVGALAAPGGAVVNGRPDYSSHPNVGLLAFDIDGAGPAPWAALCTASVIGDAAALTAAHCIAQIRSPFVKWGITLAGGAPGDPVARPTEFGLQQLPFVPVLKPVTPASSVLLHPQFGDGHPRANDLAVLTFPAGTFAGVAPVQLPPVGALDQQFAAGTLAGRMFTLVGYGADLRLGSDPVVFVVDGYRQAAAAPFQALTPMWLRLQMTDAATGGGGLCRGDSGAPYLDGPVAMAIHSEAGSHVCAGGASNGTRLDTDAAHAFLAPFLQP